MTTGRAREGVFRAVIAAAARAGAASWLLCVVPSPVDARPAQALHEAVPLSEATPIDIDGDLSDAGWTSVVPITEFQQREPLEGGPPSQRTEVRVAYDATHLYVAVRALDDDPALIVAHLNRRDEYSPSDWIHILVDSYRDRRTAYEFAVNPVGVKVDKYWFDDGKEDASWDAVWDVQTAVDDRGWRAEFRIPFSQLRFNPASTREFGFAVVREIARINETSTWPLLARSANGYVSSFGQLNGLRFGQSPKRLELVPYTVAQVATDHREPENPLINPVDPGASVGLDLKYAFTPGLTLTSTINPDFGQVEADPAVVNLTAFETFFAERRPFFVEGGGIFRFDVNCNDDRCTGLFYSRRIGRTPQEELDVADEDYAQIPAQTTILGAAKVTGRIGRFSFGALNALTQEETATIAHEDGQTRVTVEPFTNYAVLRGRREFADQSSIGFMATSTARRITPDVSDIAANAFTGGIDWDWRVAPAYALRGYWAGSAVRGTAEAIDALQTNGVHTLQRTDARTLDYDPTRTSLAGTAAQVSLGKIAGERTRFSSVVSVKTPGFDINDVGFLRRADERTMSNWLQVRHDRPWRVFRSLRGNLNQWAGWNADGDRISAGFNVNAHAVFTSNWRTGAGYTVELETYDDRLTRGGPGGLRNPSWTYWQYIESDNRRPLFFEHAHFYSADGHGTRQYELSPSLTYRPTPSISVNGGLRITRNDDDAQWIEEVEDGAGTHYAFGRLHQTTFGLTTRVNYTLTRDLSIQVYAEPFVSAGDYTAFKELVDGRAPRHEDRFAPFAYQDNPDFNFRSFRMTNVVRWEYKPGSTLFVVWQQGREEEVETGDFSFARDFASVFGSPAANVFLVKLAYWLNS
jgi:hypothetical protein